MIKNVVEYTEDEMIMAEFADVMDDVIDEMFNEEEELENEAIEEYMAYGCMDDADIILDQDLEEHPMSEAEIEAPWNPVKITYNIF